MQKIVHFFHHEAFFNYVRKEMLFIKEKEDIMSETTLLIPNTLIKNEEISNYGLAVYCVLQALTIPTRLSIQCISRYQIVFYLTGNIKQRRLIKDYIRCGISELIEQDIVKKIDEVEKNLILDCSNLWIDTNNETFTKITFEEVQKIFKVENVNNFLLLKYFILLMGTISNKITVYLENGNFKNRVVGNFTIDYLSEFTGLSDRSIMEYNKKLEEINVLYVYRQKEFIIDEENNIKRLVNLYGRPCDIEYINKYANSQQKHYKTYTYIENNINKANNKRRYAQMYLQLLKDETRVYPKEEIIAIYNYVLTENQKYERLYEKEGDEKYLDKIRDTDVFDRFNYLEELKE